jgi:nitrite reductase/ring-hydroxylating ferredoxin subunit
MNKLLLFVACSLLLFSCGKDENQDKTKDFFNPVYVNVKINLTLAQYNALSVAGGWVYEPGGNKGLIVYHTAAGNYVAYDRTCPEKPTESCSYVSVDSNGTRFMCGQYDPSWKPCCGSIFVVESGAPTYGPAKQSLHAYQVNHDGDFLYIFN